MLVLINVFNETMGISQLLPAAECDMKLTSAMKGALSSMTFFGIMLSGYMWGFLGDTQGRRWVIMWSLAFSTIFTLVSAFVANFVVFSACRFMAGVFVGGYSSVMYAYVGEFNVAKYRAAMISWISVAIGISNTFMPLIALWILRYDFRYELYPGYEFRAWRLALLIYASPGVIGGLWMLRLPESPRFLLAVKRDEEALKIVQWIQKKNNPKSCEQFFINRLKPEANSFGSGTTFKGVREILNSLSNQTLPLLKPPYLVQFAACCVLQFGTFCIAGGISLFFPDILHKLSMLDRDSGRNFKVCEIYVFNSNSTSASDKTCNDSISLDIYGDIIVLGISFIIGFVILAIVIRPSRRRSIIAATFVVSSASGFLLPLVEDHYLIIACFCSFIIFAGLNVSLINGAACDIFPVNLRAMAVSVSMLVGRFGSVFASNVVGNTLEKYCIETYYFAAIIAFFCFAVSFVITK